MRENLRTPGSNETKAKIKAKGLHHLGRMSAESAGTTILTQNHLGTDVSDLGRSFGTRTGGHESEVARDKNENKAQKYLQER